MSRYFLLLLFNLPFILAGIISAVTQYKLNRSTKKRMFFQVLLWGLLFIGLALAQPIYEGLFARGLTQTESLSLFDVVQITLIIFLLYVVSRMHLQIEVLDDQFKELHQRLSIKLSTSRKDKS